MISRVIKPSNYSQNDLYKGHAKTVGRHGENVACTFLCRKGFTILERNYLKKWGEIDIIAQKQGIVHFFEVKSVAGIECMRDYRPEENVHFQKTQRMRRTLLTYLAENTHILGRDPTFQVHVLCVFLNFETRQGRVKWIENVII